MQPIILLRDKFVRGWKNAQHRFSNCFAAMLRDELGNFVPRITVPLTLSVPLSYQQPTSPYITHTKYDIW